jgi:hypothetical protein
MEYLSCSCSTRWSAPSKESLPTSSALASDMSQGRDPRENLSCDQPDIVTLLPQCASEKNELRRRRALYFAAVISCLLLIQRPR